MFRAFALFATLVLVGQASHAAETFSDLATATLKVTPAKAKPGDTVKVELTITPKNGGWTYPFVQPNGSLVKNSLRLPKDPDLIFPESLEDPPASMKPDGSGDLYYPNAVTWKFDVKVADSATPGKKTIDMGRSRLQACDEQKCIPAGGAELPSAELEIEAGGRSTPVRGGPEVEPKTNVPTPAPKTNVNSAAEEDSAFKTPKLIQEYERDLEDVQGRLNHAGVTTVSGGGDSGLAPFLLSAALFGLISLITPCVFPMIPITVSIFLKQAHGSMAERLKLAGVYCLTIITVLGLSAFALLRFMSWLSTQPLTNVLLGLLFVVLSLSLFGMYELTLPNFMVNRLQSKQAKGGVVGTIFGALAFTVISFTCVAPFLGGFAGIAQADTGGSLIALPTTREVLGGLAFATAFAAPFFVLALVPGLLKALPRSGGWLDSVKVVMGFLELAAALKFFRTAELRVFSPTAYFTYDLVLAGWVAIAGGCGLYLLGVFRLPHDEEKPNIGVPRLLFAMCFLGLSLYLMPALFKNERPRGAAYAWIEAFLLPETKLHGSTDLKDAIDRSLIRSVKDQTAPKPIFLDFTGVTCTNCKYNEREVFTRPEVAQLLGQFEIVQLYTDEVPAEYFAMAVDTLGREDEATANREFQQKAFGTLTLPLYAVLLPRPDGKVDVLGVYDLGKIQDVNGFVTFLRDSLAKAK